MHFYSGPPMHFYSGVDTKMAGVAVLVVVLVPLTWLEARLAKGDAKAEGIIRMLGPIATLGALTALIFAVITFD